MYKLLLNILERLKYQLLSQCKGVFLYIIHKIQLYMYREGEYLHITCVRHK